MTPQEKTAHNCDKCERLQAKITILENKLEEIKDSLLDKTGIPAEDALAAAHADRERDFYASKLDELKAELEKCQSAKPEPHVGINVGDFVRLVKLATSQVIHARLADNVELYVGERCLSVNTPMGQALLGKKSGDCVDVVTPIGEQRYLIV